MADIDIEGTIGSATRAAMRRAALRWHVPVVADFDIGLVNSGGTATADDVAGKGILFTDTVVAAVRPRWLMQTAPATPYTVEAIFRQYSLNSNFCAYGLCLRDSASDRFVTHINVFNGSLLLATDRWSNQSTYSAGNHFYTAVSSGFNWRSVGLRIVDDGTNHTCFHSYDGEVWQQVGSTVSRTAYLANPNQVGVHISNQLQSGSYTVSRLGMFLRSFRVF